MSARDILEVAIIAFIALGFGIVIWKGGARNPVGTGSLHSRLSEIKVRFDEIETRVEAVESKAASGEDIKRLEAQNANLAASLADIEGRQRALADRMADHARHASETATTVRHIDRQVQMIYAVLVPKGMEK